MAQTQGKIHELFLSYILVSAMLIEMIEIHCVISCALIGHGEKNTDFKNQRRKTFQGCEDQNTEGQKDFF